MQFSWPLTIIAVLSTRVSPAYAVSQLPSATIDAGVIVGTTTKLPAASTAVNKFLGIPFAAPPTRFSPPQKPQSWSQPLDTKDWKPACIQQFVYPEAQHNYTKVLFNSPPPPESEDCLYLNVYAPAIPAAGNGRAVLFWIYGGGLQFGHASHPYYDGSFFAAFEDVIIVSTNYRLNVFGFPTSPEVPTLERNLGFLDQRLALDWVQRNIHAFGGDASKVTIFGESAGAFSVDALLTSHGKTSQPPFRAAILQSGQLSYRGNFFPAPASAENWNSLAVALNCTAQHSNLACIRAAPATTIKDIIERQSLLFNPTRDNATLVTSPRLARTSGNIARIPVLSGTNAQEGRITLIGEDVDVPAYLETFIGDQPDLIPDIVAAYPVGGSEFPTAYDAIAQIETDLSEQCGEALVANDTAASGIPSWRYYFNASFPNTRSITRGGAYHSSEISIVFGTYPKMNVTAQEYALSNYMRGTWADFAKDPEAGPGWNAVGKGSTYLGGAEDLDVGELGGDGGSGVKVIRQSDIDGRCALWGPVLRNGV